MAAARQVSALLNDDAARERIVSSMEADVCLRSNPRRMQREDVCAFVDQVAASVSA
jgi:hypothetical protein